MSSLEQLRKSWKETQLRTKIPKKIIQDHLANLEENKKSSKNIIEGRVHVDIMDTLITTSPETEEYKIVKPIQDLVLQLLDAGKDVHLISYIPPHIVKSILSEAEADSRILELPIKDRSDLLTETTFGQKGLYELLIDDKNETPVSIHATHLLPSDVTSQQQTEPY